MDNQPQALQNVEEVHLSDYIGVLIRRRRTALAAFLVVVVGVTLFTLQMKPVYEATATLHVRDDKVQGKGVLDDLGLSRQNPVETEIEILKSRTIAEEVVRRLHLDWQTDGVPKEVRFKILDFSSTLEEPEFTVELSGGSGYRLLNSDKKLLAECQSDAVCRGEGVSLLLAGLSGTSGQKFELTLAPFNATVRNLREVVKASEVGKGTDVIKLSYQDTDAELSQQVVNSLATAYLERSIHIKTEEARKSVEFIEKQLGEVRGLLDKAELSLEQFKRDSGVVQLDTEAQNLISQLADADKARNAVSLNSRQVEFAIETLSAAMKKGETYAPTILLDDPVVSALASKLAELEVEKRGLLADMTELHPLVQAIFGQIREAQDKLLATYRSALGSQRQQLAALDSEVQRHEGILKKLPEAERELVGLTRRATVNAGIYTFLLQKHEEARIAQAATIASVNVIDPAITPDRPIKPQKAKNLLLGLIVGGMLGVGLAFFREYLDDTIKDEEGVRRVLGYPVLSIIPHIGRRQKNAEELGDAEKVPERTLIAKLEPKSPAAEAFRSLRTSIHYSGLQKAKQVLLVSSTFPGEGKTTLSANLAVTLAQTGGKVLLVGCDLRRPTLHTLFNQPNTPGLTEVLVGDATLEQAIHPTGLFNLDFISAGTTPPNPAELLGSEAMAQVLKELRGRYDTILLDAPPLLAVTDAAVLTTQADLALLVLQVGRVPLKLAGRTRDVLSSVQAPIAGVILNDKSGKGVQYYGYYGRGGYSAYGYGYEETAEPKKRFWQRK